MQDMINQILKLRKELREIEDRCNDLVNTIDKTVLCCSEDLEFLRDYAIYKESKNEKI